MQTDLPNGATPPALLAPTEALGRGFDLGVNQEGGPWRPVPTAAANARASGLVARQGFRIGSLNLMIPYEQGSELTDLPKIYRLPHAPAWLLGMANLHGLLVPVFDLAHRFGIEREAAKKPMLLVLGHGDAAAGVLIEGLPRRLRFGPDELIDSAAVPTGMAHLVTQAAMIDEQLWFDLAVPALLDSLSESSAAVHF